MTQTMIECVARAICWKNGMNPDLTLGGDGENFLWHEYDGQARAAIDAMQLCIDSEEFMAAVSERTHDWRFSESGETYPVSRNLLRAFFDAALAEGGDE